jgi:hypothetical protein
MIGSGATGGVDDRVDVRGRRPVARRGNARLDWHWRMAGNELPVENGWRSLREQRHSMVLLRKGHSGWW